MDFKSSRTFILISSFFISVTSLGTVLGIFHYLGFSLLKDYGVTGIVIIVQLSLIIAFLTTYLKTIHKKVDNVPEHIDTLKSSGLVNAFRIKEQNPQRIKRVIQLVNREYSRSGHRRFRLIASSGYSYLDTMGNVWIQGLRKAVADGVEFKVVLESPFSSHAYARALACNIDYHHWTKKVDLNHLEQIINEYNNLEIKVTPHPVNCSLFFTSESVYFDPYLWALPEIGERVENHFWVFEFMKSNDSKRLTDKYECYSLLELHFEFLYKHSVTLKKFLGPDRKNYYKLSDEFPKKLNHLRKREN